MRTGHVWLLPQGTEISSTLDVFYRFDEALTTHRERGFSDSERPRVRGRRGVGLFVSLHEDLSIHVPVPGMNTGTGLNFTLHDWNEEVDGTRFRWASAHGDIHDTKGENPESLPLLWLEYRVDEDRASSATTRLKSKCPGCPSEGEPS